MSAPISMRVDDSRLQRTLSNVTAAVRRPPMKAVASELAQNVRNTFRKERDPWGTAWTAHSPLTLAKRRKHGNASVQKLIDSGRMYASIRDSFSETDATVTMGEGLPDPRAEIHQFGTDNAGRNHSIRIPARPSFPLRDPNTLDMPAPWWPSIHLLVEKHLAKAAA